MDIRSYIYNDNFRIISKLSQEEVGKRQYYRPIYSIHKWWARRPGALFRSILLLVEKKDEDIFLERNNGQISENSDYFQSHDYSKLIILDPFMGGGTTLVEANRLGFKVIGSDLNPVSYWIVREELKKINLKKLTKYFSLLEKEAGQKIRDLYSTKCSKCNNSNCDSLYVFWLRSVKCPICNNSISLFKRSALNEGLSRTKPLSSNNLATVFCPNCYSLSEWDGSEIHICPDCRFEYNPNYGTYSNGFFDCPYCGEKHISLLKTLKKSNRKITEKIIAIEYWCNNCKSRHYKEPDSQDLEKIDNSYKKFENEREDLIFPQQKILPGASSLRWRRHNYEYYWELFTPRQILAYNYLIKGIGNIPEKDYRDAFITILSNSLEYNNIMTPYNYPHRKLHHLFNYHAMPLTTTPVENVVWGSSKHGAGTVVNCYTRYYNAKKYCAEPFDKFKNKNGDIITYYSEKEKIDANFVNSFTALQKEKRSAFLLCEDSSNLKQIPNESVDFVVTDPPYYDNIHYSELSNFFYVWLKLLISDRCFESDNVPFEREAIVNNGMQKTTEIYKHLITSVFQECNRVLKNDGLLIFTFHHTKWLAWWTILNAIGNSGFMVTSYFPVQSEYKVNPHVRNKEAMDMDLVIICKKKHKSPNYFIDIQNELEKIDISIFQDEKSVNFVYLYYFGRLLEIGTKNWGESIITQEWFEENLTKIEDFIKIQRLKLSKKSERETNQTTLFD